MKHRNELGAFYQEHFKTGVGAEIGVQFGLFSEQILKDWKGALLCVDYWQDQAIMNDAKRRLDDGRVTFIHDDTLKAAQQSLPESLDFVFIDAGHQYEEVKADLEAWFPKVRKGGVVSGHDYVKYQDFGVIEAVDEFAKAHGYTVEFTDEDWWEGVNFISWYFIK
jgi:hypothetical protein